MSRYSSSTSRSPPRPSTPLLSDQGKEDGIALPSYLTPTRVSRTSSNQTAVGGFSGDYTAEELGSGNRRGRATWSPNQEMVVLDEEGSRGARKVQEVQEVW